VSTGKLRAAGISILAASLLMPALSGCSMQRQRINIENPFTRIQRVKEGRTRAEELPAIFGTAPSSVIPIPPDKEGYVFSYGDSKTFMLGIILLNFQKTNTGIDTAIVVLDRNGVVEKVIHSENSKDLPWQFWPFGGE
jgi:hypothetical protein